MRSPLMASNGSHMCSIPLRPVSVDESLSLHPCIESCLARSVSDRMATDAWICRRKRVTEELVEALSRACRVNGLTKFQLAMSEQARSGCHCSKTWISCYHLLTSIEHKGDEEIKTNKPYNPEVLPSPRPKIQSTIHRDSKFSVLCQSRPTENEREQKSKRITSS